MADLARAQLAVVEALACGADRRIEIAERRVALCAQRLRQAAHVLDRVLVERGDEGRGRRLVEGAVRLTENV